MKAILKINLKKYLMGNKVNNTPTPRKMSIQFEEELNIKEENEKNNLNYYSGKLGSFHLKKDKFIGEIIRGKKEGKGVYYYNNGDKYEGNFKDDKKEGKGSFYFNEKGEIYKGNFENDYPNGMGKYFFKNGDRYEGMFKDGKMHGEGTLHFANGGRYKGEFKNGLRHGKGEYKNELGQIKYEYWDNGVLKLNGEEEIYNNESVSLYNERDTKKFDEFLRGTYRKKPVDKTSLLNKIKQIKEKSKNKINDQQLVQILDFFKEKPNIKNLTVDEVKILFEKINLEKYIPALEKNSIDGKKLLFLDNSSISNIFQITDKIEIKIITTLIEFIRDVSNNEEEKIKNENNNINKIDQIEAKKIEKIQKNLSLNKKKEIEENEKKNKGNYSNIIEQTLMKIKGESFIKELYKLGKSEFYSALNNDSLNFFINYDEIKIVKKIGEGGMAVVNLGEWQGKKVTIKTSKLLYNSNTLVSKTFINEINILASLRHPNILLFMGVSVDNNTYYMINEYLPGGTLSHYLHIVKGNLTEKQKIKIALQLALAIKYIHSKNIMHCDIKSENVFLDDNFNAKLGDFNLSYIMTDEPKLPVGGTYRWMSPEVLKGKKYEKTSDIYSYGLVLWELLTRKIPYSDAFDIKKSYTKQDYEDYFQKKIDNNEEIIPIPKNGNIALRFIVSKCLEYNPKDRINVDNIIKYLSRVNKCYEEVDETILEIYNFIS